MRYFLIAGEASGDMHASNLIKEIKVLDNQAVFQGIGGDRMLHEGMDLIFHYKDIAYMGFLEVVLHLKTILDAIRTCKRALEAFKPDALILVDYPGFNLRIAQWAKTSLEAKIFYYISPQVWAWKAKRTLTLKQHTDQLYCILPFEPAFFKNYDFEVKYVGHPLLDELDQFTPQDEFLKSYGIQLDRPLLVFMPGSRKQEIEIMLPAMIKATADLSGYQKVVACAPGQEMEFYRQLVPQDVPLILGATYSLLHYARLALVTSGTATLETALFEVPQIVCYKGSAISYQIAKRLVRLKYISLVNLILDKEAVKELIQGEMTVDLLKKEIQILQQQETQERLRSAYAELKNKLSKKGASAMVANDIFDRLRKNEGNVEK